VTACCQVTTTLPDLAAAGQLAARIVAERLAACAQVQGPITSTYRWHDAVEEAEEWYCHWKTRAELFPILRARIRELHPYETPEIIAVPIAEIDADYAAWIAGATAPDLPSSKDP
jgi:periplasmic divalent cation tolerance protein